MRVLLHLSTLAAKQLVASAVKALGFRASEVGLDGVGSFLSERFTDHSKRLLLALERSNQRAWTTLEVALEGESLWRLVDRADDKALRQQIRAFLDATPLAGLPSPSPSPSPSHGAEFRQECLRQLRSARKAGLLGGSLDLTQLALTTASFARFDDPHDLLAAEWRTIDLLAEEMRQAGQGALAYFIGLRTSPAGMPLVVTAVRYFLRREIETDAQLFHGLAWADLAALREKQDDLFAVLVDNHETLRRLLDDLQETVHATHEAVLDIQAEQDRHGQQLDGLYLAVLALKERFELDAVAVRPGDSLALSGDAERRLVKEVLGRFRVLPEPQQRRLPALLNSLAQLEVAAGDLAGAQRDFQEVATLVTDRTAQAEAHHNVFTAALEKPDYPAALAALLVAAQLDAERFAPCPLAKYEPEQILGAGGFGVALLCRNRHSGSRVVVKALRLEMLQRHVADVFREARVLEELDHPAIIRVRDCDYADQAQKRPYLVMDFFDGPTLAAYLKEHGTLSPDDLRAVAGPVAEALAAAHARGILHRDVKPANILVRKDAAGWRVKLIDFGLAQKQRGDRAASASATTYSPGGTAEYAAPEQLGKLPGVPVGSASDVYGFAKTCCFALFGTVQPLRKHWHEIPEALADLLEHCLHEAPAERIGNFEDVLRRLKPATVPPPTGAVHPGAPTRSASEADVPGAAEESRLLKGHFDAVLCAAFLVDGQHALTGSADRTVRLWNLAGGENWLLQGHDDRVASVCPLPDGKHVVTASADKTVRVWDIFKGQETRRFDNRTNRVVAVSDDGEHAASGSTVDGMIRYWHLPTGREIRRLKGHMSWVLALAFCPKGHLLVSASADGTARVWDVETGNEVRRLEGHKDKVQALAVHPVTGPHMGKAWALTGSVDRSVRLWDLKNGKQLRGFPDSRQAVAAVALSGNGMLGLWEIGPEAAPQAGPGTVGLWDLQSGRLLRTLDGHRQAITALALHPDKPLALTGSADGMLRLWRLEGA
jgi:hypothetical protein